ncbi:hypothetical protein KQX54_019726 [Cotesia glomerata]|uniref:Uncharacterized protein n=1 Tax=Cotesia glomerata TaxID=32391 RepID=A0AAV7IDX3_COTGL|nr:hypothetical protein KQX54_019726 [Cotesia glomerata]
MPPEIVLVSVWTSTEVLIETDKDEDSDEDRDRDRERENPGDYKRIRRTWYLHLRLSLAELVYRLGSYPLNREPACLSVPGPPECVAATNHPGCTERGDERPEWRPRKPQSPQGLRSSSRNPLL